MLGGYRLMLVCLIMFSGDRWAWSQQTPPPPQANAPGAPAAPATQPAYPALEKLNAECVSLLRQMQGNVLRVQVPPPRWDADADPRFNKYKLNSDVNRALQQQRERAARGSNNYEQIGQNREEGNPPPPPAQTQPTQLPVPQTQPFGSVGGVSRSDAPDQNANPATNNSSRQGYTIIVPAQQAGDPQQLVVNNTAMLNNGQAFSANNIGLLLSDRGHVLVPAYLEREAVGDQPIKLACGDGEVMLAKFIGSDQHTQLSVLQLDAPGHIAAGKAEAAGGSPPGGGRDAGKSPVVGVKEAGEKSGAFNGLGNPVKLSDKTLPEGTLVLMLSPTDGSARLSVWNGGARDTGVVVTINGEIAGISRQGQFLSSSACKLIADQIVRHGTVRRATLGVIITQVEPADPARQAAALGDKPAVRVDQVMKDSVAEKSGLRKGDLILTLAGKPVHDIPGLAAAIAARQGVTELRVLRDDRILAIKVDLVQK